MDWTADAAGNRTSYEYYYDTHLNAGRLKAITQPPLDPQNPVDKKQYLEYTAQGEQRRVWGDTAYPVEYVYDDYGQKTEMHTYRGGSGWNGSTWPGSPGTADVTRWVYEAATGLLTSKTHGYGTQDADTVSYTYTAEGKLYTRTWARTVGGNPLITNFAYSSATGELTTIFYSLGEGGDPNTPAVTFTYDRLGRKKTVTDVVGTRTLAYNDDMTLGSEDIDGSSGGLYSKLITRKFDTTAGAVGRSTGFQVGTTADPDADYDLTYGYQPVVKVAS